MTKKFRLYAIVHPHDDKPKAVKMEFPADVPIKVAAAILIKAGLSTVHEARRELIDYGKTNNLDAVSFYAELADSKTLIIAGDRMSGYGRGKKWSLGFGPSKVLARRAFDLSECPSDNVKISNTEREKHPCP